uniref:Uncharacterized protein n=1 Tax=Leersia perrieri TaxID=77586 RepID=A0A0D9WQS9_9ORYZ
MEVHHTAQPALECLEVTLAQGGARRRSTAIDQWFRTLRARRLEPFDELSSTGSSDLKAAGVLGWWIRTLRARWPVPFDELRSTMAVKTAWNSSASARGEIDGINWVEGGLQA